MISIFKMEFFIIILIASTIAIGPGIFAQSGIKTHQPVPPSGNLVHNLSAIIHNYQDSSLPSNTIFWNGTYFADEKTLFINKTKTEQAPGVCFKEVLTASLVRNTDQIPAGNGSDPSLSRIQVCCEGYERNMHNFRKCDPICKNECVNGLCTAPDVCSCFPDHIQNLGGFCIPTCPIGCGNGVCQPDGTCQCKAGYILDPKTRKFCIPLCNEGCQNGNCTEPNVCSCLEGYRSTPEEKCVPKCDNCENGECTAPNVCVCKSGYIRKENKCEPVCSTGCNNGFCSAPNTCSCPPGFTLDPTGTNCLAHCDKPCLNGYCSGNNLCSCNSGYVLDEFDPHICKPYCHNGCPNGFCTSPNLCICNPGFVKAGVKGRQSCTKI